MTGEKLSEFNLINQNKNMFAVKEAVFPFNKFPNVDVLLGPEMKSTGEVMGIDKDFGLAYAKSQIAAGNSLPTRGWAFISLQDKHKNEGINLAKKLVELNFTLCGTAGTADIIKKNGIIDGTDIFVETYIKPIKIVIVGAVHIAPYLIDFSKTIVVNQRHNPTKARRDHLCLLFVIRM